MNTFDPNDPAAEIKYLKALEQGKAWPTTYPDPAKVKKGKGWPAAVDPYKVKKTPRRWEYWTPPEAEEETPFTPHGIPLSELVRVILIFAALATAALLID